MSVQRRAFEPGHRPKCLVVVDDTEEADRAVYYASRWASRNSGAVVMMRLIETEDRNQQWLGVADIMRAEAHDEASLALDRAALRTGGTPERIIREGEPSEQILDVIEKDADITLLILAASDGVEGPGPILSAIAAMTGSFPIPVTVVPGALTDAQIDGLS